jgi:hypothetical protein
LSTVLIALEIAPAIDATSSTDRAVVDPVSRDNTCPLCACVYRTFVDQFIGTRTARLSALFSEDGLGESNCVEAKSRAFDLAFW